MPVRWEAKLLKWQSKTRRKSPAAVLTRGCNTTAVSSPQVIIVSFHSLFFFVGLWYSTWISWFNFDLIEVLSRVKRNPVFYVRLWLIFIGNFSSSRNGFIFALERSYLVNWISLKLNLGFLQWLDLAKRGDLTHLRNKCYVVEESKKPCWKLWWIKSLLFFL